MSVVVTISYQIERETFTEAWAMAQRNTELYPNVRLLHKLAPKIKFTIKICPNKTSFLNESHQYPDNIELEVVCNNREDTNEA